jgi:hypothetical protein
MVTRDRVTPELHEAVLFRDRQCLLSAIEPDHVCRDRWGNMHEPWAWLHLTVEHVKDQPRMGKRAPSDMAHLVALCYAANVGVPSKSQREAFRAYLREVSA